MTALERQRNILANALQGRLLMWIHVFLEKSFRITLYMQDISNSS